MYKAILVHKEYIESRLAKPLKLAEREVLYKYHIDRVRDFQHERLIHLLVTLFFGFLLLISLAAFLLVTINELCLTLGILTVILFILELAYIRHYYRLENGVQSLYKLTEKLYKD